MLKKFKNLFFILASKSPRRIEFLKNLNLNFKAVASQYNEKIKIDNISPIEYCQLNAYNKAMNVADKFSDFFVCGFDTIVEMNKKILGKPHSWEQAEKMLLLLSNKSHNVYTAYSIMNKNRQILINNIVRTSVTFKKLSINEIKWYISTNEPLDKAGAYAIQGIGSFMIKTINGSYTNVVGLPLAEFLEDLSKVSNVNS